MRALQRLSRIDNAYVAWCMLWNDIKHSLANGQELEVEIREAKRNLDQNAKLHATIDDIAGEREWAGKKRDPEVWKRLLMAAWLRARGESVEVLPALDGYGVDVVFRRSSALTKAECSELLEFVESWRAMEAA